MANLLKDRFQEAFNTISSINKDAYEDVYLMSNEVLSKNPFRGDFLDIILSGEEPGTVGTLVLIRRIISYYIKSVSHYVLYLSRFLEYFFSGARFKYSKKGEELVLIDSVFLMERIVGSGSFGDYFMPGLDARLKADGSEYAYLPLFYSTSYNKRPAEIFNVMRILKKTGTPVLSEFQLLKTRDLFSVLSFIMRYPFHVLRLAGSLPMNERGLRALKFDLLNTIDHVTFYSYTRYLQGKRAARLPYKRIKLISWYENRPVYKNLYAGIRSGPAMVKIYGAQLFIYSKDYLTITPDENESRFGVIPDKIITNGPYFIPEKSSLNYEVGPSLRYSRIFNTTIRKEDQNGLLVLLPYPLDNGTEILKMLNSEMLKAYNVVVKAHPGVSRAEIAGRVPSTVAIKDGDIYELLKGAKIVIGTSSGTLMEAASLGIPAISVKTPRRYDYHNPLPEYGKGVIWEEADSAETLIRQIDKLCGILESRPDELNNIAGFYRKMFFCETSDANMRKAFDL